jgi:tRNA A37 threonylcarbamoyladenosine synthetase subunit TsaC/SUA5/YrdC
MYATNIYESYCLTNTHVGLILRHETVAFDTATQYGLLVNDRETNASKILQEVAATFIFAVILVF